MKSRSASISFNDNNLFIGFVCLIIYKDIVNILYLAVSKEFQGKGYGHQILEIIKRLYPHHRFMADIEKDEDNCVNKSMRRKRELFYLHDDYVESDIEYNYKGVDYIIMTANGNVSKKEFKHFWRHFYKFDDLGRYITNYYKY